MDAPNGELFLKKPKEVKLIGYDYSFTDCLFKLIVENNTLKLKHIMVIIYIEKTLKTLQQKDYIVNSFH